MDNRLLSIITINYNNTDGLRETMKSVMSQTWKDFEHIVIDGGSTDSSVEVIQSFSYDHLIWISEPDHGIYNAMNKGIKKASGKYLLFLNSGDVLSGSEVLSKISSDLKNDYDLVIGSIKTVKEAIDKIIKPPSIITLKYLLTNSLPHPSTFYKNELFEIYGMYNEQNKIVSDWEFNLKLFASTEVNYKIVEYIVSVFDLSGISSSTSNRDVMREEGKRAVRAIYGELTAEYILNTLERKTYKSSKKKKLLALLNKLYKWR
ncbi:glycosyltransferase family 2 protein [Winogradskyella sp.]|uniref:glycosyltransferase family 2 protein n=1 Tax=Winogradskyella sp. TaxID=1883156 RepID=UPI002615031A|nr:glycosyltransferase family 2 protein [Winogradskyella sp.]